MGTIHAFDVDVVDGIRANEMRTESAHAFAGEALSHANREHSAPERSARERLAQLDAIREHTALSGAGHIGVLALYAAPVALAITAHRSAIGPQSLVAKGIDLGVGGLLSAKLGHDGIKSWNLAYEVAGLKSSFDLSPDRVKFIESGCQRSLWSRENLGVVSFITAGAILGARVGGLPGMVLGALLGTGEAYLYAKTKQNIAERQCVRGGLRGIILSDLSIKHL